MMIANFVNNKKNNTFELVILTNSAFPIVNKNKRFAIRIFYILNTFEVSRRTLFFCDFFPQINYNGESIEF